MYWKQRIHMIEYGCPIFFVNIGWAGKLNQTWWLGQVAEWEQGGLISIPEHYADLAE